MKALLLSIALALGANGAWGATMPPWNTILGPPQGNVPGPASFTVTWRRNLAAAMVEARQKNRPLFVTFRCLPCKQCADFDKAVLEGGPVPGSTVSPARVSDPQQRSMGDNWKLF